MTEKIETSSVSCTAWLAQVRRFMVSWRCLRWVVWLGWAALESLFLSQLEFRYAFWGPCLFLLGLSIPSLVEAAVWSRAGGLLPCNSSRILVLETEMPCETKKGNVREMVFSKEEHLRLLALLRDRVQRGIYSPISRRAALQTTIEAPEKSVRIKQGKTMLNPQAMRNGIQASHNPSRTQEETSTRRTKARSSIYKNPNSASVITHAIALLLSLKALASDGLRSWANIKDHAQICRFVSTVIGIKNVGILRT